MANGTVPKPPMAYYDFYKTNGQSQVFYTEGPSLCRQEFAEECDINSLMKRYEGHVIGGPGNLPPMDPSSMYVDFAEMPQTLMEYVDFMDRAERGFMSLPAVVRKEFDNNAVQFVGFASDPSNLDQMRSWGLAPPAKAPAGEAVPQEPPPQSPSSEPPKSS